MEGIFISEAIYLEDWTQELKELKELDRLK
jgi:hypothetical protein